MMSKFCLASQRSSSSSECLSSPPKNLKGYNTGGTIVLKSHTGWVLFRHWIHLAAVAVTAGIATLNILDVYLVDLDGQDTATILNAFQFAAKLHEVLIVGSLMLIMMDNVRSRLLTSTGVPFGYLLAPVLFNDFDWLMSHQFWSSVRPSRTSLPLTALTLAAIPFANLAGPISAIAVVPRLGWSAPYAAVVYPSFWNASASMIWPERLTAGAVNPDCEGSEDPLLGCPNTALLKVYEAYSPGYSNARLCTSTGELVSCNTSIGTNGFRKLALGLNVFSLTSFSSTPTETIYELLANRFAAGIALPLNISGATAIDAQKTEIVQPRFLSNGDILKPVTKTTCAELSYAEIYETFQDFKLETDWSKPVAHWLADIDGSSEPNFLYTYRLDNPSLDAAIDCNGQDCYAAVRCHVDARWYPSKVWFSTAQSTLYESDPDPMQLFASKSFATAHRVHIERGWLEKFGTRGSTATSNSSTIIRNMLNDFQTPMVGSPKIVSLGTTQGIFRASNYSQQISVFLSSMITESLSRASMFAAKESIYTGDCNDTKEGFTFDPKICARTPSHWVRAKELGDLRPDVTMAAFTLRRGGYGWFIQDSVTVRIALGTLLFHGFLTLLYLAAVLAFRREFTTCWSSAPEMLMLAIDSLRAPAFMGSSAKATHRDLWREPVSVMEVDGGERVSLVVGDPLSYADRLEGPPMLGKKYS